MLIDTGERRPQPDPEPRVVELDWRLWSWVVTSIAFFVAAKAVPGLIGPLLALAGFFAALKGLDAFMGRYDGGLREWRQ